MAENRLFIDHPIGGSGELWLDGDPARYVGRSLRLRPGSALTVFDGSGGEYAATVLEFRKQRVLIGLGAWSDREAESPLKLHLVQSISRGDRFDLVVQKATELGVQRISPVLSEHSVVRLDAGRAQKKVAHWTRIAQSACEQCGRNSVTQIDLPVNFHDWLDRSRTADTARLILEPRADKPIAALEPPLPAVEVLIGPEGGWSGAELEAAAAAGLLAVTMGLRILRTETAALTAVSILQSRFGDL